MALNVTELKNGTFFQEGNNILQVLTYEHVKMGRGNGTVKLRVKNLKTGSAVDRTYMTGAKVDEADVAKKKVQFLYRDEESFSFMDPNSFEQFTISSQALGNQAKYLKDGIEVILVVSGDEVLGLELPSSLVYQVAETGPGEKGNSVSNVFKEAVLENGLVVKVPLFIDIGEKIKVDTRCGEYIERVR